MDILAKLVPAEFKEKEVDDSWKQAIVPSAESLESFERLVARRREKNRVKREKSIYRRVLESDVNEFYVLKFMLHFPFGLIFGYVLFKISLDRLDFSPEVAIQISLAFILTFAVCFAFFVTFRCLAVLIFPHIFGEVGRIYIYTICIGIIVAGPMANFVLNVGEILRSIGCQFEVFVNLTMSRFGIRILPLLSAMMDIVGNQANLQSLALDLVASLQPVDEEANVNEAEIKSLGQEILDDEADLEQSSRVFEIERFYRESRQDSRLRRMQKNYMKKMELYCEKTLSQAVKSCVESFKFAFTKCMNKMVFIAKLICYGFKLTIFCDLFKAVPRWLGLNCSAVRYMHDKFADAISTIDELTDSVAENFQSNIQFMGENEDDDEEENEEKGESEGVGFVTKSVLWQYSVKKVIFNVFSQALRRLLVLIFIFLIYRAQHYMQLYLTILDFDNRYITSYFKRIDQRRKEAVKRTLLPLKKLEQREISYMCSWRMTDDEKSEMFRSLVRVFVIVCIVLALLFVDYLLAEIMDFVASIARMDFIQHGRHHLSLNLTGTGIIANMLRRIFNGFNNTHIIDNVVSNKACLPVPQRTTWTEHWMVYLCVIGVFVTAITEAAVMRTRRLVCDFFYPKREKIRVLFLYNDMLRKRVGFLHEARHKVRKKCKRNEFNMPLGFLTSMRYQFPGYFEWLRKFNLGRQKCLICNDPETGEFIHCPIFQCKATYCRQCWIDVYGKCYACRDDDDWTIVSSGGGSQVALLDAKSPWKCPMGPEAPRKGEKVAKKKKKKKGW